MYRTTNIKVSFSVGIFQQHKVRYGDHSIPLNPDGPFSENNAKSCQYT